MKYIIVSLFFSVLFVFVCTAVFGQPFKQLTANDFKAQPAVDNGEEIAFTSCSIAYSYDAEHVDNYYLLTFTIRLSLNADRSWIDKSRIAGKRSIAQILNHEQGHYNIAYLEQQELKTTVSHTVFYDDYIPAANKIFQTIDAKYRQLNHNYDAETQNSANLAGQRKWDAWFEKQLNGLMATTVVTEPANLRKPRNTAPLQQPAGAWKLLAFLPGMACKKG